MEKKSIFFTTERVSFQGFDFFTVKSRALGHRSDVSVYKPAGHFDTLPVVILLHGVYGSHWAWAFKANVHATLDSLIQQGQIKPMMLVMPSDGLFKDGSGYLRHHAADYEQWIAEDVPALILENYEMVDENTPFFIAGLSMGGYGALRIGAKNRHRFKAFSGLSSITTFEQLEQFVEDFEQLKQSVVQEENVLDVLLQFKDSLSPFRFDCGEEDLLYDANRQLHEQLIVNHIPHEFCIHSGEHNWEYWTQHIAETLVFFSRFIS